MKCHHVVSMSFSDLLNHFQLQRSTRLLPPARSLLFLTGVLVVKNKYKSIIIHFACLRSGFLVSFSLTLTAIVFTFWPDFQCGLIMLVSWYARDIFLTKECDRLGWTYLWEEDFSMRKRQGRVLISSCQNNLSFFQLEFLQKNEELTVPVQICLQCKHFLREYHAQKCLVLGVSKASVKLKEQW